MLDIPSDGINVRKVSIPGSIRCFFSPTALIDAQGNRLTTPLLQAIRPRQIEDRQRLSGRQISQVIQILAL